MKKVGIAAFTDAGRALADRITEAYDGHVQFIRYESGLKDWCACCFAQAHGLIFIGACGIAVRTIAPFLKSKMSDPAVLVIDEKGQYVISLLSGHIGGANEFAEDVAELIGAVPVVTTASDVNGLIAVDVFAKKNHLAIASMKAAKLTEAALLRRDPVGIVCCGGLSGEVPKELTLLPKWSGTVPENRNKEAAVPGMKHLIWISEKAPGEKELAYYFGAEDGCVLHLIPRSVMLGIGCRKGKPYEEIRSVVGDLLKQEGIPADALDMAASIDLKKEEDGIKRLCREYGIGFATYPAEMLRQVPGTFEASEFVRKTTGVDNVCERAALLAAGEGGKIIRKKYAENGVTAALAVRKWRVCFGE